MSQVTSPEERMGRKKRKAEPESQQAGGGYQQARQEPHARAALELWITLSKAPWASVVLVPAEPEGSTASLAKLLADIGQKLSFVPVTAIAVSALEYGSALALADLQGHVDRERQRSVTAEPQEVNAQSGRTVSVDDAQDRSSGAREGSRTEAITIAPAARLVISIPSVIDEPLGLSATQQADAVVVMVELGRTRTRALRRTIDLIGRDSVTGCFVV
jgi:hypothetical protein